MGNDSDLNAVIAMRKLAGLSQEQVAYKATELARKVDPSAFVGVNAVRRLERGDGTNIDHLPFIAEALGETSDTLIVGVRLVRAARESRRANRPAKRARSTRGAA